MKHHLDKSADFFYMHKLKTAGICENLSLHGYPESRANCSSSQECNDIPTNGRILGLFLSHSLDSDKPVNPDNVLDLQYPHENKYSVSPSDPHNEKFQDPIHHVTLHSLHFSYLIMFTMFLYSTLLRSLFFFLLTATPGVGLWVSAFFIHLTRQMSHKSPPGGIICTKHCFFVFFFVF